MDGNYLATHTEHMDHSESEQHRALVRRYLDGDGEAFASLVRMMLPLVYGYAMRMTGDQQVAEDIAQETFVKTWKNVTKFDFDANFRTWILTIAHRTTLDWFRKKKHVPFSDFDTTYGHNVLVDTASDSEPLPDELFMREEQRMLVETMLTKLSPQAKEVIVLYYEGGMTFDEIGKILGEPLNTVKSRYRRALATLRSTHEDFDGHAPK